MVSCLFVIMRTFLSNVYSLLNFQLDFMRVNSILMIEAVERRKHDILYTL